MTRAEAVRETAARLRAARVEDGEVAARALALEAFGISLAMLLSDGRAEVADAERRRLDALAVRRAAGEPIDRILGRREFWGRKFRLSPDTLSPRADTETVVEAGLATLAGCPNPRILDLGSGSGCILLALLSERCDATGVGLDRAYGAALAASENAETLGLEDRAVFVVGDWTAALAGRFDLIVSNPPYIASGDIAGLEPEVREHDPRIALDGGADGLDAYRTILREAGRLLAAGGAVVVELGFGQHEAVAEIGRSGGLVAVEARADLGGVTRALTFRTEGSPSGPRR